MSQFEASYSPQAFHADHVLLDHAAILARAIDASYSTAESTRVSSGWYQRLVQSIRHWHERRTAKAMARRQRIDQIGASARAVRPGINAANAPHFSSAA